ncbi:MAG TPA: ABC transporter substrate-binding protein [Acidocella sp.]|nr:ABC transporter substrate-binding protein [Acidocella sp.]
MNQKNELGSGGISRRLLMAGATGAGLVLPVLRARAAATNTIKVGFISPRTGPLAGFGEGDPFILGLARKAFANGMTINGTTYEVIILDRDTQSDPTRASKLAQDLINGEQIDLMLTTSTPEVVNPVSDACEAAGVPCLSTIVPWEAWYFGRGAKPGEPSPFKWTYHFCFGGEQFRRLYMSTWNNAVTSNKRVAVMCPSDADGNAIRANLFPALSKAGFDIVDPGGYQDGTTDYSAQISLFKQAGCEIFSTFPFPPDFTTFWRQAAQQGLTRQMKIVTVAKTGLFPSQMEALGPLGYRINAGTYWHPAFPYNSALTGLSSAALAAAYETQTGRQWQQQLGPSMALFDAMVAVLKSAGNPNDKDAVAKAMSTLQTTTVLGNIDFLNGPVPNVATTTLVGAQWIKAKTGPYKLDYVTIEHAEDPSVPTQTTLQPYHL